MVDQVEKRFDEWLNSFSFFRDSEHIYHKRAESKKKHVYNVKIFSEKLAKLEGLSDYDKELAGICGLLHDCGRFLELERYGNFNDFENKYDHAKEGAQILKEGLFSQLYPEAKPEEEELIIKVAEYHQMSSIPEGLSKKEVMFLDIIKAADSLDLFERACTIPDELNMDQPPGERTINPRIKELFARGERINLREFKTISKIDISTLRLGLISIIFNNLNVLNLIEEKDYITRICMYLRSLDHYNQEEINWLEKTAKKQFEEKRKILESKGQETERQD